MYPGSTIDASGITRNIFDPAAEIPSAATYAPIGAKSRAQEEGGPVAVDAAVALPRGPRGERGRDVVQLGGQQAGEDEGGAEGLAGARLGEPPVAARHASVARTGAVMLATVDRGERRAGSRGGCGSSKATSTPLTSALAVAASIAGRSWS